MSKTAPAPVSKVDTNNSMVAPLTSNIIPPRRLANIVAMVVIIV